MVWLLEPGFLIGVPSADTDFCGPSPEAPSSNWTQFLVGDEELLSVFPLEDCELDMVALSEIYSDILEAKFDADNGCGNAVNFLRSNFTEFVSF